MAIGETPTAEHAGSADNGWPDTRNVAGGTGRRGHGGGDRPGFDAGTGRRSDTFFPSPVNMSHSA